MLTLSFCGLAGSVSTGLMHATPGDMKSFSVSTDRMADILNRKRVASALLRWSSLNRLLLLRSCCFPQIR